MSDAGPRQARPYWLTAGVVQVCVSLPRSRARPSICQRTLACLFCERIGLRAVRRGFQKTQAQQRQFLHGDLILADQHQIGADDKLPSAAVFGYALIGSKVRNVIASV